MSVSTIASGFREFEAGGGVLVLMNDELHCAAEITKTDTTNPHAMKSPNRGRAGSCDTGKCVTITLP